MNRRGFSLLEVLVASALIFFLLIGTAEIILHSTWAKRNADDHFRMAASVASQLESMKALPFEGVDLRPGSYRLDIGGETEQAAVTLEWRIEPTAAGIKKIDMLAYCETRREAGMRAVLLLSKHLGF